MEEMAFIDYLNAVDDLLDERCGITTEQADLDTVAECQDEGWLPSECADWLAEKHKRMG